MLTVSHHGWVLAFASAFKPLPQAVVCAALPQGLCNSPLLARALGIRVEKFQVAHGALVKLSLQLVSLKGLIIFKFGVLACG